MSTLYWYIPTAVSTNTTATVAAAVTTAIVIAQEHRKKATQLCTVVYHFHRVSSSALSDFLPRGFFAPSSIFTFTYT